MTMVFLKIPKPEQAQAKALGARWHSTWRQWWVPEEHASACQSWRLSGGLYDYEKALLEAPRLYVDLVPKSSWGQNLAHTFKGKDWDVLRKATYAKYGHQCGICGQTGAKGRLDAHERWAYDGALGEQRLSTIEALCPSCHLSTHMGFANASGRSIQAMAHLAFVNRWSAQEANLHVQSAFAKWSRRNQQRWQVDLTWLKSELVRMGMHLTPSSQQKIVERNEKWYLVESNS